MGSVACLDVRYPFNYVLTTIPVEPLFLFFKRLPFGLFWLRVVEWPARTAG